MRLDADAKYSSEVARMREFREADTKSSGERLECGVPGVGRTVDRGVFGVTYRCCRWGLRHWQV